MKKCVVIGKTNVGKTLFTLKFAEYLGVGEIELAYEEPSGRQGRERYHIDEAIRRLSGDAPHQTRRLQSIRLELPAGKGVKRLDIVDSSGLIEGIHDDVNVRKAMAQTLGAVRDADLILHLVDAHNAGVVGTLKALGDVDYQVAQFAQMRDGYLLLANKTDLAGAQIGLQRIREEFPHHPVVPISALRRHGFREVKRFVWRWI